MAQNISIAEGPYRPITGCCPRPIPRVDVDFFVIDQKSGSRELCNTSYYLDTGFEGGLKQSDSFALMLKRKNIDGPAQPMRTAGKPALGKLFQAEITCIRTNAVYKFPDPLAVPLVCFGEDNTPPLLGLQVMNKWVATFDGPKRFFRISG